MQDKTCSLPKSTSDCKQQLNSTHFNSHIAPPFPHPPNSVALGHNHRSHSETPNVKTHPTCRQIHHEEINIYGKVYQVDYTDRQSVEWSLGEVERSLKLEQATKTSIQWLVMQRAVQMNCSLQDLLDQAIERYEKRLLSSIFN